LKLHDLKTINPFFDEVYSGRKLDEIRFNDRDFRKGDLLMLREYDPILKFTGKFILAKVTYILTEFEGLTKGYCAMSLRVLDKGILFKGDIPVYWNQNAAKPT
jgi:hypothetical protein